MIGFSKKSKIGSFASVNVTRCTTLAHFTFY
jgi:hypothetical protein